MLAAFYESTGPAAQMLRLGTLPDPVPGPGELRVRRRWSGGNPSDVKSRARRGNASMPFARIVPRGDGMGVVEVDIAANASLDLDVAKEGGTWVVYSSGEAGIPTAVPADGQQGRAAAVLLGLPPAGAAAPARRQLLAYWLGQGQLRHLIAARHLLTEIDAAHDSVAQGGAVGNVVVSID